MTFSLKFLPFLDIQGNNSKTSVNVTRKLLRQRRKAKFLCTPCRHMEEWKYNSTHSWLRHFIEVKLLSSIKMSKYNKGVMQENWARNGLIIQTLYVMWTCFYYRTYRAYSLDIATTIQVYSEYPS